MASAMPRPISVSRNTDPPVKMNVVRKASQNSGSESAVS
jgi:hypothetical protein